MKRLLGILTLTVFLSVLIFLTACGKEPEPDPHEGQVYVNDGFNDVWITPVEGVEVNPLVEEDFTVVDEEPVYQGNLFSVRRGIDVFSLQFDIDWPKVKADGIDFAIVQAGYRGYTEGGLFPDKMYEQNLKGAAEAGLDTGVYFFSQATNVQEAIEEAEFVLDLIKDYTITLPVFFDWETEPGYRTAEIPYSTVNDCAVAFCETVKNAGYSAGIYFSKQQGYYNYDLARINDYSFWVVDPGDFLDFYYAGDIWQYSIDKAMVDGIETAVDLNMMFIPLEQPGENS